MSSHRPMWCGSGGALAVLFAAACLVVAVSPRPAGAAVGDLAADDEPRQPAASESASVPKPTVPPEGFLDLDPAELLDRLRAIPPGDTSEAASAVVEQVLGSSAFGFAKEASAVASRGVPVRLGEVWRPGRLLSAFDTMTYRLCRQPTSAPRPDTVTQARSALERWQRLRELSLPSRVLASVADAILATRAAVDRCDEKVPGWPLSMFFDLELFNTWARAQLRAQLADLERLVVAGDAWALLCSQHARVSENLALLGAVDRNRSAALLLTAMLSPRPSWGGLPPGRVHRALVDLVGVDHGDPSLAAGERPAAIRLRWREWAHAQGWWSLP